jgi:hypothetical protein
LIETKAEGRTKRDVFIYNEAQHGFANAGGEANRADYA